MILGDEIIVNSRRFDKSLKKSWNCRVTDIQSSALTLVGEFAEEVTHPDLGTIEAGTVSTEYFWLGRWYNIFRFERPDGTLRNWYCNICMPPTFGVNVLDYVDLDIDVVIWPVGRVEVLDEDEYTRNRLRFAYPLEVQEMTNLALQQVLERHERKEFPFYPVSS